MLVFHCLEDLVEVWTTEVRFSLQTSECASSREALEVLLAYVLQLNRVVRQVLYLTWLTDQHHRAEVKAVEHLGDEDVGVHDGSSVHLFNLAEDVHKPFKVLLIARHPDEIHLQDVIKVFISMNKQE